MSWMLAKHVTNSFELVLLLSFVIYVKLVSFFPSPHTNHL